MATWLYKGDQKELVPTKRVQIRLKNGWSVTPEKKEVKRGRPPGRDKDED